MLWICNVWRRNAVEDIAWCVLCHAMTDTTNVKCVVDGGKAYIVCWEWPAEGPAATLGKIGIDVIENLCYAELPPHLYGQYAITLKVNDGDYANPSVPIVDISGHPLGKKILAVIRRFEEREA